MTSMNISLPEPLKEYVKQRVSDGTYSTPSDYVRDLIREDRKRQEEEQLERMLIEGLQSGEPQAITREWWQEKRAELLKQRQDRPANRD